MLTLSRRETSLMLRRILLTAGVLALAGASPARAQDTIPLKVGVMAPEFTLTGATRDGVSETPVRLSDFRDQTVVIAFFYKARTKG
jgi:thioredoxin-dependent peroxiredoxin